MGKIKSVQYNFIMNFILTSSNFLFPLITFPYVSRVLMAAGNGKVSFATSIANYFIMVASLGIPTYGIRVCAKVRDDKDALSKTVHELLIINLIMTGITTILFLISIVTVDKLYAEKELMFINLIGMVLNTFGVNWLYSALEQYSYITIRSIAFKALSVILMFLFVSQPSDYIIYGGITVFATAGSNILNFIRIKKYIYLKKYDHYEFRRHIKPILLFFAQSVAVVINTNLDLAMLGFLKGDVDVGLYTVAIKIKSILVTLVTSLGTVLLPRLSYYVAHHKIDLFECLIKKATSFVLIISIPLSVFFIVMAKESILFLAGGGYLEATFAMQFIMICVIIIGLTNITGIQILTPLNREREVLHSIVVSAIINIVTNSIFIPLYGINGAALCTVAAQLSGFIVQLYVIRQTPFHNIFNYVEICKILFCSICPIILLLIVKSSIDTPFLSLFVGSCFYFGTFLLLCVLLKIDLVQNTLHSYFKKISNFFNLKR